MLGWLISLFWQSHPVETREEALNIAQTAIQSKWPGDYSQYIFELRDDQENKVWHFRYFDKEVLVGPLLGGLGPGVDIRKSDGKITYLKGQK